MIVALFSGLRLLRGVPVPVLRPPAPRRHPGAGVEKQHHGLSHALPHPSHARIHHQGKRKDQIRFEESQRLKAFLFVFRLTGWKNQRQRD